MGDEGPSSANLALRKAGLEYFESVLAQSRQEADPFAPAPAPKHRRAGAQPDHTDDDMEVVGEVLAGSRLYVIGAIHLLTSASSLLFIKVWDCRVCSPAMGPLPAVPAGMRH